VLASGGTACIDEFDKMKETDRVAIHEAMEQQTVSIAKAGIVATLQSKTSIIAAANPKSGRYDDYKTPADNINLSPPILSRFDLIFIVRDKPNQHEDDRIADFVLSSHMEGYDDTYMEEDKTKKSSTSLEDQYIQLDLLKKYVRYARNTCHPQLTRETAARIKAFYVKMRNSQPGESAAIAIVARTLEGIIRMCEAYAKMAIRDFVLIEDVDDVIELVNRSLKEVGFDQETGAIDVDRVLTGNPKSKKDKIRKILDKIQELQEQIPKAPVTLDDIFTPLASGGITRSFLEEALEELTKEATIYQPKPGEYRVARKTQANPKKIIEQTEPKNELSEKNEKGGN
jgi:replicative DNA helicase Mcm